MALPAATAAVAAPWQLQQASELPVPLGAVPRPMVTFKLIAPMARRRTVGSCSAVACTAGAMRVLSASVEAT